MEPPDYPVGPNPKPEDNPPIKDLINIVEKAPQALREALAGLSDAQLDTKYKNWTIRQIVHHLADSHTNGYINFKLTLTADQPTTISYDRNKWVDLPESRTGSVEAPLALLEGLNKQWVQLMRSMTEEEFSRVYINPRNNQATQLLTALGTYAWHGRHHTGQIIWMREQKKV